MAGIKQINSANPGLLRATQCSDLQDIWDGLAESLASDTLPHIIDDETRAPVMVVSGVFITSSGFISEGVIAFKGKLYWLDGTSNLTEGATLYAHTVDGPDRALSGGSVAPYNFINVVNDVPLDGELIGVATKENVDAWRLAFIPNQGITAAMIADGAIGPDELASGAVTQEKIANEAVGYDQIADGGVGGVEKVDNIPSVRSPIGFTTLTTALPTVTFEIGELEVYTVSRGANVIIEAPGGSKSGVNIAYIRNTYSSNITITLPSADVVGDASLQLPANKTAKIVASVATGEFGGDTVYEVTILDAFCYSQV